MRGRYVLALTVWRKFGSPFVNEPVTLRTPMGRLVPQFYPSPSANKGQYATTAATRVPRATSREERTVHCRLNGNAEHSSNVNTPALAILDVMPGCGTVLSTYPLGCVP